jgi:hypothetical protein
VAGLVAALAMTTMLLALRIAFGLPTPSEMVGDRLTAFIKGFYEQQGWGPNFVIPIRTTFFVSDFTTPFTPGARIPIRGNAFAGNRGVGSVEVSIDGGQTWQAARIDYPGTDITWAFWTFDWQPGGPGEYLLVARATDRHGQLQDSQYRDTAPEGATGYPGLRVRVTS